MKNLNGINLIHNNKVNNISECNLIHDILNPFKQTKNIIPLLYMNVHWKA